MKKVLITVLILLLIILGGYAVFEGITIGKFSVFSYSDIIEKNAELEAKIIEASQLTSVTFPEKMSSLTKASNQLVTTRERYEDKVAYSSEEDVRRAREVRNYEVDFLFTKLGNYVSKNGIQLDLSANSKPAAGEYNLNFTLFGKYVLISEFIRDIENDSELSFIIENFKLTPAQTQDGVSDEILKAEFEVTAVKVNTNEGTTSLDEAKAAWDEAVRKENEVIQELLEKSEAVQKNTVE